MVSVIVCQGSWINEVNVRLFNEIRHADELVETPARSGALARCI